MYSPGEITYYEKIGAEGRKSSINKPFSEPRCGGLLMELGAVMSLLPEPPARVLDCGCGTGWVSYFLAKRGYRVVGQDVASDAVQLARDNPAFRETGDVEFVVSDFDELDYRDEFDAVIFFASLHHALDEQAAINSGYRALKPGGVLIASEPGAGHEKRSQAVKDAYDVTDRDMPPTKVIRCGRRAGFRTFRIYQHGDQLCSALYSAQPGGALRRLLWTIPGARYLALFYSVMFYKRYNGISYMVK